MQLELGQILNGKVTGITKFGAFIELEPGTVGLVHISEVASNYVNDIHEYLKIDQSIAVKVLSIANDGKISLSIRKAIPQTAVPSPQQTSDKQHSFKPSMTRNRSSSSSQSISTSTKNQPSIAVPIPKSYGVYQSTTPPGSASFESMLNKFMKSSDEKISKIKKSRDSGRRSGQHRSK